MDRERVNQCLTARGEKSQNQTYTKMVAFFFFLQKPKVTQWKKIAFSTNSATAKLETYIWSDVSKDMSYNCHKKSKLRWMILLKLLRFGIGFLKDETSKT